MLYELSVTNHFAWRNHIENVVLSILLSLRGHNGKQKFTYIAMNHHHSHSHTQTQNSLFFLAHTRRPTQYIGFLQTFMFFSTKNHTAHDFQIVFLEIYLLQFNWMAHPIFDWSENCSDGKPSEKLLLLVARKNRWRLFFQCDSALNHAKF